MRARKVVLFGIDGLRIDSALGGGRDGSPAAPAPALARLVEQGGLHRMTMEVPTISGPGWSSLLTGTTHAVHGVFDNSFHGNRLGDTTDFLSRAVFADPRRSTFAASGWPPIVDPAGPGPIIATRLDQQRLGRHRIVVRDGETYGYRSADGEIAAWGRMALRDAGPDASFIYLGEVDEAGHLYGGASTEYTAAIRRVDEHLGGMLAVVEQRSRDHDEDWLVAVTTDHGHVDAGGHGGAEPEVTGSFLATVRYEAGHAHPGVLPAQDARIRPEDVAGLLLAHLG